jgi:hypothetical protein
MKHEATCTPVYNFLSLTNPLIRTLLVMQYPFYLVYELSISCYINYFSCPLIVFLYKPVIQCRYSQNI